MSCPVGAVLRRYNQAFQETRVSSGTTARSECKCVCAFPPDAPADAPPDAPPRSSEAGRVWPWRKLVSFTSEKLLFPGVSVCPVTTTALRLLSGWDADEFFISTRLRFVSVINREIGLFDVRRARWRDWLRCILDAIKTVLKFYLYFSKLIFLLGRGNVTRFTLIFSGCRHLLCLLWLFCQKKNKKKKQVNDLKCEYWG